MKKLLVLLAAGLMLAGCATQTEDPETRAGFRDIAIETLREQHPEARNVPDDALWDAAGAVCDYLDVGGSFGGYTLIAVDEGFTPKFAGALFAMSVVAVCPEHADRIP